MRNLNFIILALPFLTMAAQPALASDRLSGKWLTENRDSHVQFQPCDSFDCGRIVWLEKEIDPETGKAWTDKFNPDETLKSKPLNGLVFISDLKAVAQGYWEGNLYNPRDGRTYRGSLQQQGPDKLELKGCALFGLICQSEFWTRVAP